MENSTENRICRATIDCGDGRANEIEGEGIIAIALTEENDGVRVESNIEGMHGVNTLTAAIRSMRGAFGETWDRANMIAAMERMFGKNFSAMRGNAEQPEGQTKAEGEQNHANDGV